MGVCSGGEVSGLNSTPLPKMNPYESLKKCIKILTKSMENNPKIPNP